MARIVVIDDQESLRSAVRRALEPLGHEVLEADDGVRGFAHLTAGPVDVLITDIFMPGQDGMVTLRRMRKEFPGVKVIAMSGGGFGGQVDLLRDAQLLGAARILRKPFGTEDVRRAVRELLEGH